MRSHGELNASSSVATVAAAKSGDESCEVTVELKEDTRDTAPQDPNNNNNSEIKTDKDAMDDLLYQCFLCALKSDFKPNTLASTFYRNHVKPFCPAGRCLDVKKSSHKKLSAFLKKMQKLELIVVEETRGVHVIVSVDTGHDLLRSSDASAFSSSGNGREGSGSQSETGERGGVVSDLNYTSPTLEDMFRVTTSMQPVLLGSSKGDVLSEKDVRKLVTDYVRANRLQVVVGRSASVRLDATLRSCLSVSGEETAVLLHYSELMSRCLERLTPVHRITRRAADGEQQTEFRRGHVVPIQLNVKEHGGKKKVTSVLNLELFDINYDEFASRVKTICPLARGSKIAKTNRECLMSKSRATRSSSLDICSRVR